MIPDIEEITITDAERCPRGLFTCLKQGKEGNSGEIYCGDIPRGLGTGSQHYLIKRECEVQSMFQGLQVVMSLCPLTHEMAQDREEVLPNPLT